MSTLSIFYEEVRSKEPELTDEECEQKAKELYNKFEQMSEQEREEWLTNYQKQQKQEREQEGPNYTKQDSLNKVVFLEERRNQKLQNENQALGTASAEKKLEEVLPNNIGNEEEGIKKLQELGGEVPAIRKGEQVYFVDPEGNFYQVPIDAVDFTGVEEECIQDMRPYRKIEEFINEMKKEETYTTKSTSSEDLGIRNQFNELKRELENDQEERSFTNLENSNVHETSPETIEEKEKKMKEIIFQLQDDKKIALDVANAGFDERMTIEALRRASGLEKDELQIEEVDRDEIRDGMINIGSSSYIGIEKKGEAYLINASGKNSEYASNIEMLKVHGFEKISNTKIPSEIEDLSKYRHSLADYKKASYWLNEGKLDTEYAWTLAEQNKLSSITFTEREAQEQGFGEQYFQDRKNYSKACYEINKGLEGEWVVTEGTVYKGQEVVFNDPVYDNVKFYVNINEDNKNGQLNIYIKGKEGEKIPSSFVEKLKEQIGDELKISKDGSTVGTGKNNYVDMKKDDFKNFVSQYASQQEKALERNKQKENESEL